MCLTLKHTEVEVQIAEQDIVVYKRLVKDRRFPKGIERKHGIPATATIYNRLCEGKISIDSDGSIYFCHNFEFADGCEADDLLGYKYSWEIDDSIIFVTINGKEVSAECIIKTPYRKFVISIGETYISDLIKENGYVYKGIHSFEHLDSAKKDGINCVDQVYAECIIPKGSKYYKGLFDLDNSYASDTLTYVRIVE